MAAGACMSASRSPQSQRHKQGDTRYLHALKLPTEQNIFRYCPSNVEGLQEYPFPQSSLWAAGGKSCEGCQEAHLPSVLPKFHRDWQHFDHDARPYLPPTFYLIIPRANNDARNGPGQKEFNRKQQTNYTHSTRQVADQSHWHWQQ